jgi:acetoacetyl-CoA synthetase
MPNIPETLIAMLATASLGAIWSVCAPDYGLSGVVDRFSQLKPKILLAVDNYTFAGKIYSRTEELRALQSELDEQLVLTVLFSRGDAPIQHDFFGPTTTWADAVESPADIEFQRVPFDHPLWVLFSSGTTGPPKGIVHSHGGITLEQLKQGALGHDLRPTDRWYFYSSPSWAAWNTTVGTLLHGCTVVLYDGSPTYPDPLASWRVASESKATIFGSGAAYLGMCEKSDLKPTDQLDLTSLRLVLTTGSILAPSTWNWVYSAVGSQVRLESTLGTTDVCSGIVGGSPLKPVLAGELNGPYLGVRAEAWNATGKPVIDQGAELVLTEPMPSMPVYFWNDPSNERYREAYFSTWSGVWRNGDWVQMTRRGGITVEGRSDATLNKGGVRMGSADIYSVLEGIDGVADSLVVGVDLPGAQYYMPLFVVPAVGRALDDDLREEIVRTIRTKLSPRHVPDDVIDTPAIPRTRTGKKLELPIKKLLAGSLARDVANPASIDEPEAVDWFANFARTLRSRFNFNLDD